MEIENPDAEMAEEDIEKVVPEHEGEAMDDQEEARGA